MAPPPQAYTRVMDTNRIDPAPRRASLSQAAPA
ncbi:hypothetical protein RCH14_004006 [Massilia sp. MP_M2]